MLTIHMIIMVVSSFGLTTNHFFHSGKMAYFHILPFIQSWRLFTSAPTVRSVSLFLDLRNSTTGETLLSIDVTESLRFSYIRKMLYLVRLGTSANAEFKRYLCNQHSYLLQDGTYWLASRVKRYSTDSNSGQITLIEQKNDLGDIHCD